MMRKFNCNCFGENAICNPNHAINITIWRDKNNPDEEGHSYSKDCIYCPVCSKETTIINNAEMLAEEILANVAQISIDDATEMLSKMIKAFEE